MVVFLQSGFIRAKLLYSGKSGCIRVRVVVFGKKWLYSSKSGCNRAKLLFWGKRGCFRVKVVVFGQKRVYTSRVVVCEQSGSIRAKSVLFEQSCFIRAK